MFSTHSATSRDRLRGGRRRTEPAARPRRRQRRRPAAASAAGAGQAQRPPWRRGPRPSLGCPSTRARAASIGSRHGIALARGSSPARPLPRTPGPAGHGAPPWPPWIESRPLATRRLRRQVPSPAPLPGACRLSVHADALRLAAPGPKRVRQLLHPEVGWIAQRRPDPLAVQDHPVPRGDRVRDRRGRARLLGLQVPGQEEPGGRPDPRQHAARDRLDGRRRR